MVLLGLIAMATAAIGTAREAAVQTTAGMGYMPGMVAKQGTPAWWPNKLVVRAVAANKRLVQTLQLLV
jgi:hypothetical protein